MWYDADQDGYQDVGEPGIGNVDVNLYRDNGTTPGVLDAGDTLVGTETTGADGGYIFTGLLPGTYLVDVVNATVPTGYTHLTLNQSLSDPTGPITVTAGDFYENADFGYYQPPTQPNGAMIGDSVWYDYDGDGVRDPNEPGIPGVTVTVTDSNNLTYTDITDQNGNYLISVPTGPTLSYTVQPTAGLPPGLTPTTPVPQSVPPLSPGQQYLNADFGYDSPTNQFGTIGDQVWRDTTMDGVFGAGESGIPGVSVDVWRNPDGSAAMNGDEYIVATTTTNTSGQYTVTVPLGSYFVMVSDTANVLDDYLPTVPGSTPGANNNNQVQPYAVTLTTAGQTNNTADFGYIQNPIQPNLGVIGNQLWFEIGDSVNGLYEPNIGDVGIEGVTMELLNVSNQVIATQVTGPSGDYAFTSLPAATYRVRVASSATNTAILGAYQPTVAGPNQAGQQPQEPQPYTIVLPAGGVNPTADFGYTIPLSFTVTKQLNTPPVIRTQEAISFTIRITNTGAMPIQVLPLTDVYSTTYLIYGSNNQYSSPASNDNNNDGQIDWSDLTASFGQDLAPNTSFSVIVTFTAKANTMQLPGEVTINTAIVSGAVSDPDGNGPLPPQTLDPQQEEEPVRIEIPTAVVLASRRALVKTDDVYLSWQTANEANVLGFNILRKRNNGAFQRINGEALFAENSGSSAGAPYRYADMNLAAGIYTYALEIVQLDGQAARYELGRVTIRPGGGLN